jgi:type IV secretion system protein VirB10
MKSTFRFSARLMAGVLSASLYASQTYAQAVTEQAAAPTAPQAAPVDNTLTVPAGTAVPLTLVSLIKSKSTPIGGTVRASVAFPVTVGTRLAIPAGVYVEGQLEQDVFPKHYKQPKGAPAVSPLKAHFTRLIYPNGYTVALDAEVSEDAIPVVGEPATGAEMAAVEWPEAGGRQHGPSPFEPLPEPQTTTTTNPFAHVGPNPAVIYGPIIAFGAVLTILLLARHSGQNLDYVLYGAGYQFQMTLSTALQLDRSQIVKTAAVSPSGMEQ